MPLFQYKVYDAQGKSSLQRIDARSADDAARRLQAQGFHPVALQKQDQPASAERKSLFHAKFSPVDFTERLVPLLEAGIPLEQSLAILSQNDEDSPTARISRDLRKGLHEGKKFSRLIQEKGTLFPPLYAGVVEAGEEAGALPQVMKELRKFLTDSAELKSFLISASIYPAFLCAAGIGILCFVFGFILPKFSVTLAATGIQSQATEMLVSLSRGFQRFWWILPLLLLLAGIFFKRSRIPGSREERLAAACILKFPFIRKLSLASNLGRFSRTVAILIHNGVHLLQTVRIATRVISNPLIRESILGLSADLRQGQKLSESLHHSPYVPPLMLQMLAVGEETGAVDSMLEHVADQYDADLKKSVKRLLNLFEPVIILFLGIAVGTIVLLMFMAIMDMQNIAG